MEHRLTKLLLLVLVACGDSKPEPIKELRPRVPLPANHFVSSRTRGVSPLAVHFDASDIFPQPINPGEQPFFHYAFLWDFGDPLSGNWRHGNKSSRNDARGPIAAHVFEPEQTGGGYNVNGERDYLVTLSVRVVDGRWLRQTTVITVIDPNVHYPGHQTVCISNQGDWNGAPPGALLVRANGPNDWAIVRQHLRSSTAQRPVRVMLRDGETWTVDRTHEFSSTNVGGTLCSFGPKVN